MISKSKITFLFIFVAICFFSASSTGANDYRGRNPEFGLPVQCKLGDECFIMHYVDVDPGDGETDYACGRQTYHHHNGTDFGISDLEIMSHGIPVIAAADGIVLRVRDGIEDQLIENQDQKDHVNMLECGNGLLIDHGNGWQTQYCHMMKDSVRVSKGAVVKKGAQLGKIGASGLASFPHLHFTVRYREKVIDPFSGVVNETGCKAKKIPVWENAPDYTPTGLIRAGFSLKPPTQKELWHGDYKFFKSKSAIMHSLVFWIHVYGVLQNDKEHFTFIGPDNIIEVDNEKILAKNYRSWVSYTGMKNKNDKPLKKGIWRGIYQLKRENKLIINLQREFVVE